MFLPRIVPDGHSQALLLLQQSLDTHRSETLLASLSSTLELHAKLVTSAAFRSQSRAWVEARDSARAVLNEFFRADGRDITESMLAMATIDFEEKRRRQKAKRLKIEEPPPVPISGLQYPAVRKELWRMTYNTLLPADISGAAVLMSSIASFAHVNTLDRHGIWRHAEVAGVVQEEEWTTAIRAINSGLDVSRQSFHNAIESIAMQADPAITRGLWEQDGVAKSAIILLLSPIDEIHDPIISLVQHSFDNVDDRGDCFHVLLKRFPDAAMQGLADFLATFVVTAKVTPDSCSLAKWLVRCFTDVLDALCRPTESGEALLRSESFLTAWSDGSSMSRRITDLWYLMTTSLAVIFKRTQVWANLYATEIMVDWMRDALIFGRQMTDHIRAFEAAALGRSSADLSFGEGVAESPARSTTVGRKLVQKLEVVLEDLVSWLRLTEWVRTSKPLLT